MPERDLQPEDLDGLRLPGVSLAVLGFPVRHSISPALHNAALGEMAAADPRFSDWLYHRVEVEADRLPEVLPKLREAGFRGLNLTIPHKVHALELVSEIDPVARLIGAVNTLLATDDGWSGFNTDGYGLEQSLREELDAELSGATVILLGAGGAARAAASQALLRECSELWIGNRSRDRLDSLVASLPEQPGSSRVRSFLFSDPPADLPTEGAVIVNATSLGLRPEDPAPIDLSAFSPDCKVMDMIYNPPETSLLREARALGMPAANGLAMLVHQAACSLSIWSGAQVPEAAMFSAARSALPL